MFNLLVLVLLVAAGCSRPDCPHPYAVDDSRQGWCLHVTDADGAVSAVRVAQ